MGMPRIPEGTYRPSWDETVVDLLESVALEEMAIAHIMNAEGEKAQEVVRRYGNRDICQAEMHLSCRDAQSMINSLIIKEWLLYNKLNTVLEMDGREGKSDRRRESDCRETATRCTTAIKSV